MQLTKCHYVPFWEHKYIYSADDINSANEIQYSFYVEYKHAFENGVYYDLNGNDNYCFVLLFELLEKFEEHKNLTKIEKELEIISLLYPKTTPYVNYTTIEIYESLKKWDKSWDFIKKIKAYELEEIVAYEKHLNKSLIDKDVIDHLSTKSLITTYGKKHLQELLANALKLVKEIEKEEGKRYTSLFINKSKPYNPSYYQKWYYDQNMFQQYLNADNSQIEYNAKNRPNHIPHIVTHAIKSHLSILLRDAENNVRKTNELPAIGEGWIGETELFYYIKKLLPDCTVVHNARPEWLKPQHIDVYIENYNIAIEYQGEQHYKAVDYFGGQEAYNKTIIRDNLKKMKCKENNCILLYVNKEHSYEYVKEIVLEHINTTKTDL